MDSILDTKDAKETAPRSSGGGLSLATAIGGAFALLILLGLSIFLFVQLREARKEIKTIQARIGELGTQASAADKRTRELDLALVGIRGQTQTIAERAGITEAELERTAANARKLAEEQRKGQESLASLGGEVGKVKDDLAVQKAAIEETQARLQTAVGDLGEHSGLIARNAEDVAALKRANLRDYFEFDLRKMKTPSTIGPVAIRVKSVDVKRSKFTIELVVDDKTIEKKDKTLYEPLQFIRKGSKAMNEIVVYDVQKDRITGYLSTPKAAEAPTAK